ncbi:MAG: transcriptional repressor LexA [Acidobacteria bacterium]|nr:transcriptional repressor LexA [Acidobacteriota bacterium]
MGNLPERESSLQKQRRNRNRHRTSAKSVAPAATRDAGTGVQAPQDEEEPAAAGTRYGRLQHPSDPTCMLGQTCCTGHVPDVKADGTAMQVQELTERQQTVLNHIREHFRRWGAPPSRSELAESVGVKFGSGVQYHLDALERKGWIQLNRGRDRGIQLLREGAPVFDPDQLPEVAAGAPILADEAQAVVRVPDEISRLIHPQADLYLVVRGDSMSAMGYESGDIVAVKRTPEPAEGDIVVARMGSDITLKRFHRAAEDRIELQPHSNNPEHGPLVIDRTTADWEIVGVVVGAMIGARPTAGC